MTRAIDGRAGVMERHGWSGRWPTDEYPSDGTRLRYEQRVPEYRVREAVIACVWMGVEPAFTMSNGDCVFPTLDAYEVVDAELQGSEGRPVDDVVDSRGAPGQPDPGETLRERESVQKAMAAIHAAKGGEVVPVDNEDFDYPETYAEIQRSLDGLPRIREVNKPTPPVTEPTPLPEDIGALLSDIETLATNLHIAVTDGVRDLLIQTKALRARAEKDAAKLSKIQELLKALE